MHTTVLSPNQAISDRVLELMQDDRIPNRTPEGWAKMRAAAFQDGNLLEATAITVAQYKVLSGSTEAVDKRVLELLAQPGSLSRTDEQWRDLRSQAWTRNDVLEAAALTYTFYLLKYRPYRQHYAFN